MKLHIQLNDDLANVLLDEGLTGLPSDFAETIRNNAVKRSEIIKLVIHRHLAKLVDPSLRERVVEDAIADIEADADAERQRIFDEAAAGLEEDA